MAIGAGWEVIEWLLDQLSDVGRVASASDTATDLISERAYAELRERIVTLRLAPGTVLREDELMNDLAIGRTQPPGGTRRPATSGRWSETRAP